jgi:aminoglycoside phosphotransferase family enzyme/predicted kinase
MIPPQTQQVLDFLGDPASYSHHPATVTLHQTHASWVFVASPYVYKIKKPVDFGFMDFTTLEKRKANCEREVTLNRRLTEDIYLGVEAILLHDGKIQFGQEGKEEGEVIEWAVKMREMDASDFLSHRIREKPRKKRFQPSDLDRVIARLVDFYRRQPPLDSAKSQAAAAHLRADIASNFSESRRVIPDCSLPDLVDRIDVIEAYTRAFETTHKSILTKRITSGAFRDCHGDLHLEHIHLTPEQVNIYDCTEFNSAFREIDVACDIAFLAMDLDRHGRQEESRRLIHRVAEELADPDLPRLVNYYKCYRACVRAKVAMLRAAEEGMDEKTRESIVIVEVSPYLSLALHYALTGFTPIAFVFMGRVGSGKSTLAYEFLGVTNLPTFSSDFLRKRRAGVKLTARGTLEQRNDLYSNEMTSQVYNELTSQALKWLQRGRCCIIDATFSSRSRRDDFKAALNAKGFEICWIEATASSETIRARLKSRETESDVISDAREEDQPFLDSLYEPPTEIPPASRITQLTDRDAKATVMDLLKEISRRYSESSAP